MKKALMPIVIGFIIFVVGLICFSVELRYYEDVNGLTDEFTFKQVTIEKTLDSDKIYRITNSGVDTNIEVYIYGNDKNQLLSMANVGCILGMYCFCSSQRI